MSQSRELVTALLSMVFIIALPVVIGLTMTLLTQLHL
jgi:hypothetical protein